MQARSAYISSLSTTTIMVGAALLMLALLGATVGFRHWPHGDGGSAIGSIGTSAEPSPVLRAAKVVPPPKPRARASRASPATTAHPSSSQPAPVAPTATAGTPTSHTPVTGVVEVPPAPPAPPDPSAPSEHSSRPPSQPAPNAPPPSPPAPVRHLLEPVISPVTETVGPVPVSLPQS